MAAPDLVPDQEVAARRGLLVPEQLSARCRVRVIAPDPVAVALIAGKAEPGRIVPRVLQVVSAEGIFGSASSADAS